MPFTNNIPDKHSETSRRHVPDAAACYCMLGKLYAAHGDSKKAIDYFVDALKINSFMWDAFTGLCDIGAVVRPHNVFKITPDMLPPVSASNSFQSRLNGRRSSSVAPHHVESPHQDKPRGRPNGYPAACVPERP